MIRRKYNQIIRKLAQNGDIIFPHDFSKRMEKIYKNLPDETSSENNLTFMRGRRHHIYLQPRHYGLVAAGIICLFTVIVPASAHLQAHWMQFGAMKETEKEQYYSEVEESSANGDVYSRSFTVAEKKRMRKLAVSYEQGDAYPEGTVADVQDERYLQQGRVCFVAKSSMFFLPNSELTDEQLLQLIDFQYKRDYSLNEEMARRNRENKDLLPGDNNNPMDGEGLCQTDAIALGEKWIRKIYGREVAGWNTLVTTKSSSQKGYNIYDITYKDKKTLSEYLVSIQGSDNKILQMECISNGDADNLSRGLPICSNKQIKTYYKEVKRIAAKLDNSSKIVSGYCEYIIDKETNTLPSGSITFILKYKNKSCFKINYSVNSKEYYKMSYIDSISLASEKDRVFLQELSNRKAIWKKCE